MKVIENGYHSWEPLLPNHFRLDVDAGFDNVRNRFSVGVMVRDAQVLVRGAQACLIRHPGFVKGAELVAIYYGLDFCLQLGFSNVCIFSDSLDVVCAVHNLDVELGLVGVLAGNKIYVYVL